MRADVETAERDNVLRREVAGVVQGCMQRQDCSMSSVVAVGLGLLLVKNSASQLMIQDFFRDDWRLKECAWLAIEGVLRGYR
eukprot:6152115-Pleurochrysis_carterae.AAC.1